MLINRFSFTHGKNGVWSSACSKKMRFKWLKKVTIPSYQSHEMKKNISQTFHPAAWQSFFSDIYFNVMSFLVSIRTNQSFCGHFFPTSGLHDWKLETRFEKHTKNAYNRTLDLILSNIHNLNTKRTQGVVIDEDLNHLTISCQITIAIKFLQRN